jgi:hypothetical protein
VATGSGYLSYSTRITRDQGGHINYELLEDQSRGAGRLRPLHDHAPQSALPSGEYALVYYTAEVEVTGFFGHASNSFFAFGVD